MPRNLHERVEVVFPVRDALLRERVKNEILAAYMADNVKSRMLLKGGQYTVPKAAAKGVAFSAQDFLIDVAEGRRDASSIPVAAAEKPVQKAAKRTAETGATKARTRGPRKAEPGTVEAIAAEAAAGPRTRKPRATKPPTAKPRARAATPKRTAKPRKG
jgi:polyphosphate kinase